MPVILKGAHTVHMHVHCLWLETGKLCSTCACGMQATFWHR